MNLERMIACTVAATLVAAPCLGAQSLADRVGAVKDGSVQMTYASRPDACGDGDDVLALGRLIAVYPSMRGHGWSKANCTFGPARVVITRRDGEITAVRTFIGGVRRASSGDTDLGVVATRDASAYYLDLASTANRRTASSAIMAAAVADSVDIWRQLLTLARNENLSSDVRSRSMKEGAGGSNIPLTDTNPAVPGLRDTTQAARVAPIDSPTTTSDATRPARSR